MSFEIVENKKVVKEFAYPLAFRARNGDMKVVLFVAESTGLQLFNDDHSSPQKPCPFHSGWVPHTESKTWEPVDLSIAHP